MNEKQIRLELKEEEDKIKIEEKKENKKKKQKNKIKSGCKVEEEEKKEGQKKVEKGNEEEKGLKTKVEEENKQKEQKQEKVLNKKKGVKKEEKTIKYKGCLGKKRKRKEEKDVLIKKEEKNLVKMLLNEKNEFEKEDSESEIDLINIEPISDYVRKKKEEWNKNKSSEDFSMEEFAKSISIIQDFNYEFLNKMINKELDKFFQYYKFYQFTLTASQRKEIQNKIKDKCDLPIIKNNFIPESIKDIKEIFVNLCNSIVKIDCSQKDFLETLKKTFIENYIYSEGKFKSSIPVKYGNRELKINKLIFEIVDFFYAKFPMNDNIDNENEINLINEKFIILILFQQIFEKMELYADDEELISVFNYLFNSIYVFFDTDEEKRDYDLFKYIILCCLPFELEKAKTFLSKLSMYVKEGEVFIDDKDLKKYDIENVKADSKIHFLKKKDIIIYCKDINCNLNPIDFREFFKRDKFMLCFRYPKLAEINYLYINDDIRNSYHNLFKEIMKSKTMKQAMNIDKEAKSFKYPFDNESILNEVEQNCYLVPLPAINYFGISDKAYFSIYINSFINTSSSFKEIFIDIDNIIKSKCHELKHIYRIYMNIYNPKIETKTPEIHYKSLNTNELTKDKYDFLKKKKI